MHINVLRRPHAATTLHALAWVVGTLAMLNALYFILRVTSPVIRSDAWYFLDVFVRKAVDGQLSFTDFFVKRAGTDHALPLDKLVLLLQWRFFDLDFKIEALAGLAAAIGCGVLFHRLTWKQPASPDSHLVRPIAWTGMCLMLFSLNANAAVWTWSLVTFGYVTLLTVLIYIVVVWNALQKRHDVVLWLATFFVCVVCDDFGLVAVLAVALAIALVCLKDEHFGRHRLYKLLAGLLLAWLLSRFFYHFMPVIGATKVSSLWSSSYLLPQRFIEGGWWQWIVLPLTFPVFHESWLTPEQTHVWAILRVIVAVPLLLAHIVFWRRAWRGEINRTVFAAICLMLLAYGQLAGILAGRVAAHGNGYLEQPRYMIDFAEMIIALLLMWAASGRAQFRHRPRLRVVLPAIGCLMLLAVQIPLSIHAWKLRPYLLAYQVKMAKQIGELALDPEKSVKCIPELPVCQYSVQRRRDLIGLLRAHHLNVFSPRLQQRYPYLPKLSTTQQQTSPGAH